MFSKSDSLCREPCNHNEGQCDEITSKCVCDWTERNVEWCLEGKYCHMGLDLDPSGLTAGAYPSF